MVPAAPTPRRDIFGNELLVGDLVAFNPPRYKGIIIGKVVGFTPKKVRVAYQTACLPSNGELVTTTLLAWDLAKRVVPAALAATATQGATA